MASSILLTGHEIGAKVLYRAVASETRPFGQLFQLFERLFLQVEKGQKKWGILPRLESSGMRWCAISVVACQIMTTQVAAWRTGLVYFALHN